jgi:hypothetical protein
MEMGDAVQGAGDAVQFLPRRARTWVRAFALTAFFALFIVGWADDVALWLWHVLTVAGNHVLEPAFAGLIS